MKNFNLIAILSFHILISCSLNHDTETQEQDLNQIAKFILTDADSFALPPYDEPKIFKIKKLHKSDRDIQRILTIDWQADNEVPLGEEWKELAVKAANIDDKRFPFKHTQIEGFTLTPIKKDERLDQSKIRGLLSVSDISFNKQRDKAVIYVSFICGGECGYGALYFFSKSNNKWKAIRNKGFWIS